ncbi:hypothetical protein [Glaciibacter superstes]|uniref:hypothetical protein n=1 Tax=Glaciibacter superstes TaxID=501023 RepID=UPI0012F95DB7|nr:hypothetical protein [Glaciibacter superstes]
MQTLSISVAAIDRSFNLERSTEQNRATREQLLDVHDRLRTTRGRRQASKAIMFANGLADNPGESKSRVVAFELGFPPPELQRRHVNPRGGSYYTDLEWPEFHTIGEFDGLGKYFKEEYLGRKTPGEAMHEEKVREDHLRAEGNAFARWEPRDIGDPARLQKILLGVGLPIVR